MKTPPYQDRIDPSQPWRYRCPDCGSAVVRRNVNTDDNVSTTDYDFNCNVCGNSFDRPLDKKAGRRVTRSEVSP